MAAKAKFHETEAVLRATLARRRAKRPAPTENPLLCGLVSYGYEVERPHYDVSGSVMPREFTWKIST